MTEVPALDHDPLASHRAAVAATVEATLDRLGWPALPRDEHPPTGDLAVICFPAAKALKRPPTELARELAEALRCAVGVAMAEPVGGYCNLNFDWRALAPGLLAALGRDDYGRGAATGRRVLVEHTSANATGPFHMGRARNPVIGDTLARLLRCAGDDVTTEYYVNDLGRQAATLAHGLAHYPPDDAAKADHRLVACYRRAAEALEAEPAVREAIYDLMARCEAGEPEALAGVRGAAERVLAGMRLSLERLGVAPQRYAHESQFVASGAVGEVIERLRESPLCGEERGAHYLDLAGKGIAGRNQRFFFTRENGLSLYTTRDIAYHLDKFARCDVALNVLGEDHKLQGRLLALALHELGASAPEILFYAFVGLPGGKMSTRAGRVVYLDDMLDEAVARAQAELDRRRPDLPDDDRAALAEQFGVGALRYSLLRVQAEKGFEFRWEEALSFEGDAAPFVMYAHARACAILRKAGVLRKAGGADAATSPDGPVLPDALHAAEVALLRSLAEFPALVQRAAAERKVHLLPAFLYRLATRFNHFYRDCPVLGAPEREFRLALVAGARQVLDRGLALLGVTAPEAM